MIFPIKAKNLFIKNKTFINYFLYLKFTFHDPLKTFNVMVFFKKIIQSVHMCLYIRLNKM